MPESVERPAPPSTTVRPPASISIARVHWSGGDGSGTRSRVGRGRALAGWWDVVEDARQPVVLATEQRAAHRRGPPSATLRGGDAVLVEAVGDGCEREPAGSVVLDALHDVEWYA